MRVVRASDWVSDIGPGAGEEGGLVVAEGPPVHAAATPASPTAPYLRRELAESRRGRSDATTSASG